MLLVRTVVSLAQELGGARQRLLAKEGQKKLLRKRDSGLIDAVAYEKQVKLQRRQSFNGLGDVFGRNVHERNVRRSLPKRTSFALRAPRNRKPRRRM